MEIFLSVFRTCLREMHFAKEVFFNRFFKLPKRQMFSFVQIDPGVTLRKLMAFLELIWGHTLKIKKIMAWQFPSKYTMYHRILQSDTLFLG